MPAAARSRAPSILLALTAWSCGGASTSPAAPPAGGPPSGPADPTAIGPGDPPTGDLIDPATVPIEARDQVDPVAGDLAARMLLAHNRVRAAHCAPDLTWSFELTRVAQTWADHLRERGCGLEHSRTRYGENLAAGSAGLLDANRTTEMWYREVDLYDFARPGFSMRTGHFTQVVWRATTQLGCAVASCGDLDVVVCNYDPPGNVEGLYPANVRPGC